MFKYGSGCPTPLQGALGAGYNVPGGMHLRQVFCILGKFSHGQIRLTINTLHRFIRIKICFVIMYWQSTLCSTLSTTGPSECALLCGRNPQCAGWTQKLATTNTCFLKTRGDHKNNDPEWVHGPPCTGFLILCVYKSVLKQPNAGCPLELT